MRTKSECAYCRKTVCEVPAPNKLLEMSLETKRAILEHFLNNSEDIVEMFKVENGKLGEIEALLQQVPYGMLSGWSTYEDGMSSELQDATLKIN